MVAYKIIILCKEYFFIIFILKQGHNIIFPVNYNLFISFSSTASYTSSIIPKEVIMVHMKLSLIENIVNNYL